MTRTMNSQRMAVGGLEIEVLRGGSGKAVLLLHGFQNISPKAPFLSELAKHCSYFAPSLPGFGSSKWPKDFDTIYDLVRHTPDLIDDLPGDKVTWSAYLSAAGSLLKRPCCAQPSLIGLSWSTPWASASPIVRRATSWISSTFIPMSSATSPSTTPGALRPTSTPWRTLSSS